MSILDDKDAAAMLRELLPHAARLVLTTNANPRALPPATLQSLAGQLGWEGEAQIEREPLKALAADERGVVLATGSIYLIADLLRPGGEPGATL